jgi:hypothetical protein
MEMEQHSGIQSENIISHKAFIMGIIIIMIAIGSITLYTAISFDDPFYYLPSIPIALGAFSVSIVLLIRIIRPYKIGAGLYLSIYAIALLVISGFVVVAGDFGYRQISRDADYRIMSASQIEGMGYLDQEHAQFSLTVFCSNYYYSDISLNNVEINMYYLSPDGTKYLALQDRWAPAMKLQPKKGATATTVVNVVDPWIVEKMYEQGIVRNQKVHMQYESSIWFDTPDGLLKRKSGSSGPFAANSRSVRSK